MMDKENQKGNPAEFTLPASVQLARTRWSLPPPTDDEMRLLLQGRATN